MYIIKSFKHLCTFFLFISVDCRFYSILKANVDPNQLMGKMLRQTITSCMIDCQNKSNCTHVGLSKYIGDGTAFQCSMIAGSGKTLEKGEGKFLLVIGDDVSRGIQSDGDEQCNGTETYEPVYTSNPFDIWKKLEMIITTSRKLVFDTLISTLTVLPKEYLISLDIKPIYFNNQQARGAILFSTGSETVKYGYKTLFIGFFPNSLGKLYISADINSKIQDVVYEGVGVVRSGEWNKIDISQTRLNNCSYMYVIYVNKKMVFSKINNQPEEMKSVKCYASGPLFHPQDGYVRNLNVYTGRE